MGAGPAGLLISLMLAQKGIKSTILEKSHDIDRNPRASFYSSPTIYELRRAGLMEDIMKKAFVPDGVSWRIMGEPFEHICTLLCDNPPGKETMISLPLDELLPLMVDHLSRYPAGTVLLNHEVVAIGEDGTKAWATVQTPDGEKRFEADYVVGCDGANSKIRRELFGNSFPGFTWDKQIVATNASASSPYPRTLFFFLPTIRVLTEAYVLRYTCPSSRSSDGHRQLSKFTPNTFQVSPGRRCELPRWSYRLTIVPVVIAQLAKDGMLRITYGEDGNLTREQMRERLPAKFKAFVPGAPEPEEYEVVNFSPYKIHQRCAEKLRVGRFLLVADAAHLCNPLYVPLFLPQLTS